MVRTCLLGAGELALRHMALRKTPELFLGENYVGCVQGLAHMWLVFVEWIFTCRTNGTFF